MVREDDHDTATAPRASQAPNRKRWTDLLIHRWPTALGIAFAILIALDIESGSELYFVLFIVGLGYLVPAALNRPWAAWVVFVLSLPFIAAMRVLGVEPAAGLLAVALIFLIVGVVCGQRRTLWGMPLQTAGMIAWAAIGLTVLFVSPKIGGYLVAAGLIGHAVWDIVHYWANRVAARTYAEFCAVFDILVGATILFML
jgi:hypothetical protein